MPHLALIACVLIAVTHAGGAAAQSLASRSDAELFDSVFSSGRKAKTRVSGPRRVAIPIRVDGELLGETLVEIKGAGIAGAVAVGPLVEALSGRVVKDRLAHLRDLAGADAWLTMAAIERSGLEARYDPAVLELRIGIPPRLRAVVVHSDSDAPGLPEEAEGALRPSSVSAFLNARAGQTFEWTTEDGAGERPFQLELDGAANVEKWVIEGSAGFADRSEPWQRGDIRVTRDFPRVALRVTGGDHALPQGGFQSALPILGYGIARHFGLQPYVKTQPTGHYSFVLERPSEVTVMVNGVPTRTLRLAAGQHDVRNLALSAGVNQVQIVAKDDVGEVRTFSFTTASAGNLLAPGISQFAFGAGVPLIDTRGARSYDWERPAGYLRYGRGVKDWLTLGGHLTVDPQVRVAGSEAALATPIGNLGFDLSMSHSGYTAVPRLGYAFAARYAYLRAARGTAITTSVGLSWEHRNDAFATLGPVSQLDAYRDDISASASQALGWRVLGSATVRRQIAREGAVDRDTAGMTLSRPFASGVNLGLTVSANRLAGRQDTFEGLATLHWTLPKSRQSIVSSARANSVRGSSGRMTWTRSSPNAGGRLATSGTVIGSQEQSSAIAAVDYSNQRYAASVSHAAAEQSADGAAAQTSTATLGTALVFAGGTVAWSRPITGSFAIVAPNKTLRGHRMEVNPSALGAIATADRFGPAVVSNLQPYRASALNMHAPNLPVGYSLGETSFWLLPSYKSGTLIQYGQEGTVAVRGVMHGTDGKPLALATGTIIAISHDATDTLMFTNRAGRFALEAMRPGVYEIRLSDQGLAPLRFEIPSGTTGGYSSGVLKAKRRQSRTADSTVLQARSR